MPFILLIMLSAFLIEGIGTYVSVVGLSALFAANPVIIVLAIALDLGKVVGVSFLYKNFKKINIAMRAYMTAAVVTLMLITSAGAFGYLSKEFQKAIQGTNQNAIMVQALEDEQQRLQHRKEEIDGQISKLPDNVVRGRRQLITQFAPEQSTINARLAEIDKQLPQLKVDAIQKNTDVGPIIYIAQAFNTDPEHAVKWVIFIIIFVFDPLAISLLLSGNYLIEERKKLIVALPKYESDESQLTREAAEYDAAHPEETAATSKAALEKADLARSAWSDLDHWTAPRAPVNPQKLTSKSPPPPLDTNPNWPEPDAIGPGAPSPSMKELLHVGEEFNGALHEVLGRERYKEPLVDKLDHLTHEDLGRERYQESQVEQLDHITHEQLGRQKPVDVEGVTAEPSPVAAATSSRVLPASKPREVISLEQLVKPIPRSQLEDINDRDPLPQSDTSIKVR